MIRKSSIINIGLLLAILFTITPLYTFQYVSAKGKPIFLYIAYHQELEVSYSDYYRTALELGQLLGEKIEREVVVKVPPGNTIGSNERVIKAHRKGKADVSGMQLFAYLVAYETAKVEIAVNSTYGGGSTFYSQFLTHDQTGFDKLDDLADQNFCWGEPLSVSGYIVPSLMLEAEGLTAGPDSQHYDSHVEVVQGLYYRSCVAGATYVDARGRLPAGEYPDVYEVVQVVEVSPPIPHTGFSIAKNVPKKLRIAIATALVEISQDEDGAMLLQTLGYQDLSLVDHSLFNEIETLMANAGMTAQEVWDAYYH